MTKEITSPVKKFSGTVVLLDPIPFPAFIEWKKSIDEAQKLKGSDEALTNGEAISEPELTSALLPGLCACVVEWHLEGLPEHVTPDVFPATPRMASMRLMAWLLGEIAALIAGEEEIPNA